MWRCVCVSGNVSVTAPFRPAWRPPRGLNNRADDLQELNVCHERDSEFHLELYDCVATLSKLLISSLWGEEGEEGREREREKKNNWLLISAGFWWCWIIILQARGVCCIQILRGRKWKRDGHICPYLSLLHASCWFLSGVFFTSDKIKII